MRFIAKKILMVLMLCSAMWLTACGTFVPPIPSNAPKFLMKDLKPAEVDALIPAPHQELAYEFQSGSESYLARHYRWDTGVRQEVQTAIYVANVGMVPMTQYVPVISPYLTLYKKQQLCWWGEMSKFEMDAEFAAVRTDLKVAMEKAKIAKENAGKTPAEKTPTEKNSVAQAGQGGGQ